MLLQNTGVIQQADNVIAGPLLLNRCERAGLPVAGQPQQGKCQQECNHGEWLSRPFSVHVSVHAVFLGERRRQYSRKSSTITKRQGVINSTWMVELTIPPMLGAAIGFMISIPVPVEKGISDNESTMVATVINFGRKRVTEPSTTASMYD